MDKAVIYIHGKGGNAEEAIHYKPLFSDCDVIGLDYTAQFPWEAKEEFPLLFNSIYTNYKTVEIIANSIGAYPRNGRNALSEGLLQMGGKKGIPQLRTYGSAHLCHSSKRYPCASQCTIHADRHYGSDTSPPHSGGVP